MALDVRVTPRAKRELERVVAYWRAERPAAPDLLLDELASALGTRRTSPHLGTPYLGGRAGTRRMLLTQTRIHVYYAIRTEVLVLLSFWSAVRGRGPRV